MKTETQNDTYQNTDADRVGRGALESPLLRMGAARQLFGCGRTTMYKHLRNGLPSYKIGGSRMFKETDVLDFIERHREAGR